MIWNFNKSLNNVSSFYQFNFTTKYFGSESDWISQVPTGELNRAKWESEELKIKSEIFAVICHQSALFDVFKIFDVENWRSLHLNTPAGGDREVLH